MGRLAMGMAALAAVSSLWVGLCNGAAIYIKPDGTGDVPTIAAGLTAAGVGDTLMLASGTFTGAGNHSLAIPDKDLVIISETGNPDDCGIDCEGAAGFSSSKATAVVEGLTITNASGYGYSMFPTGNVYNAATIRNCVFSHSGGGVGIDLFWGDVAISNCRFISNGGGYYGGAIYIAGIYLCVTIDGCAFSYNSAGLGGAICCSSHEAQAYIRNSVFHHNSAYQGGGILVGNMYAAITNCTFAANSAEEGSAISDGGFANVNSCIIAYNTGPGHAYYYGNWGEGTPQIFCTLLCENQGVAGAQGAPEALGYSNFCDCPGFCNYEIEPYDLHLCADSPCLPGNHPPGAATCGLIGALGQGDCGCGPSGTEPATWGAIKAMYR